MPRHMTVKKAQLILCYMPADLKSKDRDDSLDVHAILLKQVNFIALYISLQGSPMAFILDNMSVLYK